MAQQTSFVRRGLVWLIPIALIALGLVFVIASLKQSTEKAPPRATVSNLNDVASQYASTWALRQAAASDDLTTDVQFSIVVTTANSANVYTARGLVTQQVISGGQPSVGSTPNEGRTVFSCVEWQIDVIKKVVKELHAFVLRVDAGTAEVGDLVALKKRCENHVFG